MLAKIKAFFMENIDGVAMGVEAMYGVDIHPYYNYSRSNAMTTENFTKKRACNGAMSSHPSVYRLFLIS